MSEKYKIQITYFKSSGKFYTNDEYETEKKTMFEVCDEVRQMNRDGKLPGLVGGWQYDILVDSKDHPLAVPCLLKPAANPIASPPAEKLDLAKCCEEALKIMNNLQRMADHYQGHIERSAIATVIDAHNHYASLMFFIDGQANRIAELMRYREEHLATISEQDTELARLRQQVGEMREGLVRLRQASYEPERSGFVYQAMYRDAWAKWVDAMKAADAILARNPKQENTNG